MTRFTAALTLCAATALAHAQYPQKPVRMIIALGAGGVADAMTRTVTDKISMGQPFVLENRPGAGGNIAMEAVIKSPPDGHVLLLIGPALVINPALYPNLAFDPLKDLVTVSPIAIAPFALFASGTLPVANVGELITLARARPGKMNYASVGAGTAGHLAAVLFNAAAGLEMQHVPYRSIQLAIPDLVSGDVQLVFNAYPPLAAMAQSGKLKLLGFSSARRVAARPDVPTLSESGLPGFEVGGWYAVLAPAATPKEIVAKLNAEFTRALNERDVAAALEKMGFEAAPMSLHDSAQFIAREAETWSRSVKLSGAKAE
jgi:tripartite-type tricarboxylate transporter receptor subunit TctC